MCHWIQPTILISPEMSPRSKSPYRNSSTAFHGFVVHLKVISNSDPPIHWIVSLSENSKAQVMNVCRALTHTLCLRKRWRSYPKTSLASASWKLGARLQLGCPEKMKLSTTFPYNACLLKVVYRLTEMDYDLTMTLKAWRSITESKSAFIPVDRAEGSGAELWRACVPLAPRIHCSGFCQGRRAEGTWIFMCACAHAQSCPTLCSPMDCSPPGFSVQGILQARILGWVAIPFSRESSWSGDGTHVSCVSCTGRQILYHECHLGSPASSWGLSEIQSALRRKGDDSTWKFIPRPPKLLILACSFD